MLSTAFFFLSKFFLTSNAHTQCLLTRKSIACNPVRISHTELRRRQWHRHITEQRISDSQSKFIWCSFVRTVVFSFMPQTIIKWCHVNIIIFRTKLCTRASPPCMVSTEQSVSKIHVHSLSFCARDTHTLTHRSHQYARTSVSAVCMSAAMSAKHKRNMCACVCARFSLSYFLRKFRVSERILFFFKDGCLFDVT